jgi:hypothetical protein
MSERDVSPEKVRSEHLKEVDERVQWAYVLAVLAGSTVVMLAFIALLGAQG